MEWLAFGLCTAVLFACSQLLAKRLVFRHPPLHVLLGKNILACLICLVGIMLFHEHLALSTKFFFYLIPFGFLVSIADYFMVKAFRNAEISQVSPLLAITPVFTLILGVFFLREIPTWMGAVGIFLTVMGCYALNFTSFKDGILAPFVYLIKHPGSRYILITATIYSVTSVILKHLLLLSNTFTVLMFNSLAIFSSICLILFFTEHELRIGALLRSLVVDRFWFVALVGSDLLGLVALYSGLALTHTAYIVALKRTAAFFVIIFAYLFLGERKNIFGTLASTALIVGGVFLLVL